MSGTKIIALRQDAAFSETEIDRIIEMAWEDRTPFEAIEYQFGIAEKSHSNHEKRIETIVF